MHTTPRVGTASWTDKTLIRCGRFYPPQVTTPEQRLRFYASQFPIVEVDSSFYAMPDARTAHQWAVRTPDDFTFNIKAFRLFTGHQTPSAAFPGYLRRELPDARDVWFYRDVPHDIREELWRQFALAIEPVRMAGKLGVVHFQFAPWVKPTPRSVHHLAHCASHLQDHVMAVELRHQSWFSDARQRHDTMAMQRSLGAVHVVVDSPQGLPNTVPPVWQTSRTDLTIVRLHGRNQAAWDSRSGASSGRFVYEYTPEELAHLAERIQRLANSVSQAHVLLNTNFEDQGVRNAGKLQHALATLRH